MARGVTVMSACRPAIYTYTLFDCMKLKTVLLLQVRGHSVLSSKELEGPWKHEAEWYLDKDGPGEKDVRQLYYSIRDAGHATKANRVKATLSSMFGWAVRRDVLPVNPAAGAVDRQDRAKENASTRYLSEAEVSRFLAACEKLRAEGGPRASNNKYVMMMMMIISIVIRVVLLLLLSLL